MSGVSASPPLVARISSIQSNNQKYSYSCSPSSVNPSFSSLSAVKVKKQSGLRFDTPAKDSHVRTVRCNSATGRGGPGSGDDESKNILDAFFLGKALAEAVNERIESTVGEFLSLIGRLQAEQQRQIQDFQVDVLERARKAKENAAREAREAQGLIPKVETASATYGVDSATSSSTNNSVTPANSPSSPNTYAASTAETGPDPAFGVSDDE
ncbi:hypothetical protein JCGZ_17560 [Jatropha curcas]|uniref:Uncharacterized protein n=1 Tax=Jatropha curcas TaxID=180498 RepID=A0A067JR90_JATCU|nr:uncharacterized protein At4g13200, chloroplastic [Jatropha curcas]KDP26402.1 hypothetical protein JCGZ_17560 [Jatropha curcas]